MALSWRGREAPRFTESGELMRGANYAFNNAARGLQSALEGVQKDYQDRNTAQILNNLSQYNNPEEVRKAIQDGSVYANTSPNGITSDAVRTVMNRPDLLAQQQNIINQGNIANRANEFNLGVRENDYNNRDKLAQGIVSAYNNGTLDPNTLSGLSPVNQKQIMDAIAARNSNESIQAQTQGLQNRNVISGIQAKQETQKDNVLNSNLNFADKYGNLFNDGSAESITKAVDNYYTDIHNPNLTPEQRVTLTKNFNNYMGNLVGSMPDGSSKAALTDLITKAQGQFLNAGSKNVVGNSKVNKDYGFNDNTTIGQVLNKQSEIGNDSLGTIRDGLKHTNVGGYQIGKATLDEYGKKTFGDNYRNIPFTGENQSKIVDTIAQERFIKNGQNPANTFAVLKGNKYFDKPGSIKTMDDWNAVKPYIKVKESGAIFDPLDPNNKEYSDIKTDFINRYQPISFTDNDYISMGNRATQGYNAAQADLNKSLNDKGVNGKLALASINPNLTPNSLNDLKKSIALDVKDTGKVDQIIYNVKQAFKDNGIQPNDAMVATVLNEVKQKQSWASPASFWDWNYALKNGSEYRESYIDPIIKDYKTSNANNTLVNEIKNIQNSLEVNKQAYDNFNKSLSDRQNSLRSDPSRFNRTITGNSAVNNYNTLMKNLGLPIVETNNEEIIKRNLNRTGLNLEIKNGLNNFWSNLGKR